MIEPYSRSSRPVEIVQIDAFAAEPFTGNPAAVCVLEAFLEDDLMQRIAAEMNLSETAFLVHNDDGYRLRWFTPTHEVDLCGHATLASAHLLWEDGHLPDGAEARFHTRSGLLTAVQDDTWIVMDFPAEPPAPGELDAALIEALGDVTIRYAGRNRMDEFVEIESEAALRALEPNFDVMRRVETRGVIVTARADSTELDFVSRMFAPRYGIPEDPVTGSAHCALAPYWAERLGRTTMVGYQASARGGTVRVQVEEDRVLLGGQAVTMIKGSLQLP